jgi:hypothetical protein
MIVLKWNLGEIGWEGGDWIYLAQNRDPWSAVTNTDRIKKRS